MSTELAPASLPADPPDDAYARPTLRLPWLQLLQISIYWFGINAIWGGWEVLNQEKAPVLFGVDATGRGMIWIEVLAAIVAIAVQPTVGTISDYTMSRWGRRKPYIIIGATLDVAFLLGLAWANTPLLFVAFLLLLEFSSNFAQGPFQGYIPDLVPEEQVGSASALVGVMSILGVLGGVLIMSQGIGSGDFTLTALVLGVVELATALGTFFFVREGRQAKSREGRSWAQIAREAWGTDILRERSYVWLLASRFFVLGAGAFMGNWALIWMARALGFDADQRQDWVLPILGAAAVATALSTIPAARISDRVGRKPVIWAACAIGATGTGLFAFAPGIEVALVAGVLVGMGSGIFLAVDWALLSELVPKASSGRYMGMSQLATALQAVIAAIFGGLVLDIVNNGFLGLEKDYAGSARWAIAVGRALLRDRRPAARAGRGAAAAATVERRAGCSGRGRVDSRLRADSPPRPQPAVGPALRASSTVRSASRRLPIQVASFSPTSFTHQASASLRLRATPASTRVSRTRRSGCRSRVMTGTLAVVKRCGSAAIRTPHETTFRKRCWASSAIAMRSPRVSSRKRSTRLVRAAARAASVASAPRSTSAISPTTRISSRSTETSGAPANQASGSRPANHPASSSGVVW